MDILFLITFILFILCIFAILFSILLDTFIYKDISIINSYIHFICGTYLLIFLIFWAIYTLIKYVGLI